MSITVLSTSDLRNAWQWLSTSVPPRPQAKAHPFVYNDLAAWSDKRGRLLHDDPRITSHLTALYIASHGGMPAQLTELLNDDVSFNVTLAAAKIDGELRKFYGSKNRFRASLGEHLAFWVSAAQHRTANAGAFRVTQPHHLSEDKGPDGLVLRTLPHPTCEVVSVKQSTSNIGQLMSSAPFRSGKKPLPKKMLDDLYKFARLGYGFARVEKMTAELLAAEALPATQAFARALLLSASYHGVALSSHASCAPTLFRGFERIAPPDRCVATYLGSYDWSKLAEAVRLDLISRYKAKGAW